MAGGVDSPWFDRKPPVGLRPEDAAEHEANLNRVREIHQAIERYVDGRRPVPEYWIEELKRRVNVAKDDGDPSSPDFDPYR